MFEENLINTKLGDYLLLREIGRGGMGTVFEAEDQVLHRRVAVKVLTRTSEAAELLARKFQGEAVTAANLDHPNIVQVYAIGEDRGRHYFAMQYVDGHTIRDEIVRRNRINVSRALALVRQVADALGCAHQAGVVHRDIKTSNLMVDSSGRLRITDFGVATFTKLDGHAGDGEAFFGTPEYSSPEQLRGEEIDGRSDIFALGVVLYEMLTGVLPFRGSSPGAVAKKVLNSRPLPLTSFDPRMAGIVQQLVYRMIAKDKEVRIQDCDQLIAAIDAVQRRLKRPRGEAEPERISAEKVREPRTRGKAVSARSPRPDARKRSADEAGLGQAYQALRVELDRKARVLRRQTDRRLRIARLVKVLCLFVIIGSIAYAVTAVSYNARRFFKRQVATRKRTGELAMLNAAHQLWTAADLIGAMRKTKEALDPDMYPDSERAREMLRELRAEINAKLERLYRRRKYKAVTDFADEAMSVDPDNIKFMSLANRAQEDSTRYSIRLAGMMKGEKGKTVAQIKTSRGDVVNVSEGESFMNMEVRAIDEREGLVLLFDEKRDVLFKLGKEGCRFEP